MKKKFRKLAVITLVISMMMVTAACGSKKETAPDDGQNPVMNFIGHYVCDRADIQIEADGDTGAKATVIWGSSADSNATWTMSGDFSADTLEFTYKNGVKTEYTYNADGSVAEEKEVYSDGTGTMTFHEGDDGTYLEWRDDKENIADGTKFTFNENSGMAGMANPWSDVASAEEAAEGAGIDSFTVPEGLEISLGTVKVEQYRCMEGLAEADVPIAAVEMTIRKGGSGVADAGEGDISGDYGEYKYNWKTTVGDVEVTCYGNREGEATKSVWASGDYLFSITAIGAGGDEDFGLSADDLSALVSGIK